LNRTYRLLAVSLELRAQLWLTPGEELVTGHDVALHPTIPMGRLDSFCSLGSGSRSELRFVEYNGESPAAIAYEDGLAVLFLATPLMRAFQERYAIRPLWARPAALQTILSCYRRWGGRDLPRVAIVDWTGVPTASEFVLFREYFEQQSIPAVIADPGDLDYRQGVLYAGGQAVDLVYKRVLTPELLQRGGLDHPLIRAVRDRAVCMLNPFAATLLHKKASLAFLSDERNAHRYSAVELAAIRQCIPWTRRVEACYTEFHGRTVDLLPFVVDQRERLVLKPNDAYGGQGVILGHATTPGMWRQCVESALEQPTVVQERVSAVPEMFPCVRDDGTVEFAARFVDCDPYVFDGRYVGGYLTRLSGSALLNVTAGGGSLVPTFVVAGDRR